MRSEWLWSESSINKHSLRFYIFLNCHKILREKKSSVRPYLSNLYFSCLHLKCSHKWNMQPETIQPENYNLWQNNRIAHVLLKDRDRQTMFTVAHSLNGQWSTDWKANASNIKYLCQAAQLQEKPEPEECVVIVLDTYQFSDRHCKFFIRKA